MTILEPEHRTYEDLRDDFMLCRTLQHAWEEFVDDSLERPAVPGDWWLAVRCFRCGTRRTVLVDQHGTYVNHPRYKWPEGYQLDEKVTRSELRIEWSRRRNYGQIEMPRNKRKRKQG